MWLDVLRSNCVFQGPPGQRGPEGPSGKPGEDVSQLWNKKTFCLTQNCTAFRFVTVERPPDSFQDVDVRLLKYVCVRNINSKREYNNREGHKEMECIQQ